MEIVSTLWAIVMGVVSGLLAAVLGYAKATKLEKIDTQKMLATALVGAVVGFFMGWYGWEYNQAYQFLLSSGMVYVFENVAKIVVRRFPKVEPKKTKKKVKKDEVKKDEEE